MKQKHQLFVFLLCISDGIVATLACYAAWAIRRMHMENAWPQDWQGYFKQPLAPVIVPLVLIFMWLFRVYVPRRDRSILAEQGQVIKAALLAVAAAVIILWVVDTPLLRPSDGDPKIQFLGNTFDSKRVQLGLLTAALPLSLGVYRVAFRIGLRHIRRRGRNLRHVLIIGSGRLGQVACRTLDRNSWTGIHPAAFLSHHDTSTRTTCLGRPIVGGLSDLDLAMDQIRPDAVYIAMPNQRSSVMPWLLKKLERYPVDVRIVPDVHPRFMPQNMSVSELDGMPVLSVRECPLYGLGGFTKRLLDIAGALAGLVIFGPVMIAIAIALKMTGHSSAIFRQRRVSLGGEVFSIYKFRSMVEVSDEPQTVLRVPASAGEAHMPAAGAASCSGGTSSAVAPVAGVAGGVEGGLASSAGYGPGGMPGGSMPGASLAATGHDVASRDIPPEWTKPDDQRITRLGAFLRRTSLDELPQLINVLKGEMSLVGPRPERPELIARFREDWRGYMLRQHVKAGMTGWAQVNGLRGRTSLRKRLQYDLFYVRHWSVWFDLRILWLTLFRGFVHRNAH